MFRDQLGRRTTVPYHRGKTLHPKVLASILRDAGLDGQTFRELVRGE
ncbi:MAG TPA: type II toxin-antitoxin system HicA family toxin [Chloroflexota bacterium]|nr:type II toxin-antitoxin system HicA family toxin [Chloroflexota bacterium]